MRYLLIIFIIPLSFKAMSINKIILPSNELPMELSFIIESIQKYNLDKKEIKFIENTITQIDKNFSLMEKGEIFFLSKSEIYKSILSNTPEYSIKKESLEETINKLKTAIKNKNSNKKFTLWIMQSILKDLKNIIDNKKSKTSKNKTNFILKWCQAIILEDTKQLERRIKNIIKISLKKINDYSNIFTTLSKDKSKTKKELIYFQIKEKKEDMTNKIKTEKILEPVIKNYSSNKIPLPVNDWDLNEADFSKSISPVNIIKPNNYYKSSILPIPTNDWKLE